MEARQLDTKSHKQVLELAASLGVDTSDDKQVRDLIQAIRWQDYRMVHPEATYEETGKELGLTTEQIKRVRSTQMWGVATQICLAMFVNDDTRKDLRAQMLSLYNDLFIPALKHNLEIAAGQVTRDGRLLPDAQQPPHRDRVTAFRNVVENPIAQAFITNAFTGQTDLADEQAHLELREKLKVGATVLSLTGEVVDAEVTEV